MVLRSKLERRVRDILKEQGIRHRYEPHSFEYFKKVKGGFCDGCQGSDVAQSRWYTPDFYLQDYDSYLEVKGYWTAEDRMKMRCVLALHHDLDLTMVFHQNNKLNKSNPTRYLEYCDKYGIKALLVRDLESYLTTLGAF